MERKFSAAERRQSLATAEGTCCPNTVRAIPRLSKAGMPSHSEGWGGLFKDEQYRLKKERFASIHKVATRL